MNEARLRNFLYRAITLLLIGIILVGAGIIAILYVNARYGRGQSISNARYVINAQTEVGAL